MGFFGRRRLNTQPKTSHLYLIVGLTAILTPKQTNGAGFIYPTARLTVPALQDVAFAVGLFSSPTVEFCVVEIAHVLKIESAVVERVFVFVMAYLIRAGLCDCPVHEYKFLLTVGPDFSHCVVFREGFFSAPFELSDSFELMRRYQSELTFCKR